MAVHLRSGFSAASVRCLVALGLIIVAAAPPALADDAADKYRATVEARAAKAAAAGNVQVMIECAYALYPLDVATKDEKPKYLALLTSAIDSAVKKNDADQARLVLELASPILQGVAQDKRDAVTELSLGKPLAEMAQEQAEAAAKPLAKYGPDMADPKVKLRGDVAEDLAEGVGTAVLVFCRPSCILSDNQPRMTDYKWSRIRDDRLELIVNFRFYGALTGNAYDATIRIQINLDPVEVLSIRYNDDCFPPPLNNPMDIADAINGLLRG